jgi:hypothetical protein
MRGLFAFVYSLNVRRLASCHDPHLPDALAAAVCFTALLAAGAGLAVGVTVGAAEAVAGEGVSDAGGVIKWPLGGATAKVGDAEGAKEGVGVAMAPRGTG